MASDSQQYVQVDKGELKFKHAADLYLYPNTMMAVEVSGVELKDWLECSANQFNQINPNVTTTQNLINWSHPTFNYDVIDGVTYKIDVTQPSKFDADCKVINQNASRIVDLTYTNAENTEITGDELAKIKFIVATNNYRAYGVNLDVRFETQDSSKAAAFITNKQIKPMTKVDTDDIGFAIYKIDLTK